MRHFVCILLLWVAFEGCTHAGSTGPALSVQRYAASEKGVHVTSTLVLGERDALLVDAQFIESEAKKLVDMIKKSGRTLRTVYLTHGHPDHTFGLPVIHEAFPDARILAHPAVIAEMDATWQAKHDYWKPIFQDDLSDTRVRPTPYEQPTLDLEGHALELLGPVAGDTAHTVSIYVPDAHTLIAGDVSYAGVHPWLADTRAQGWEAWRESLRELEELDALTVISGHEAPGHSASAQDLAATAAYISDFEAAVRVSKTPEQVIQAMTRKYPALKLPIVLQISAAAAFAP